MKSIPFHKVDIDPQQIRVNPGELFGLLGEAHGELEAFTEDLIKKCVSSCKEVSKPQGGLMWAEALPEDSKEQILMEGIQFNTGKIIKKMLSGSEAYALLIVSVGMGPESRARELMEKGEFLEGYITDLVASAMVDSVADQVQEHIRRMAGEKGLLISNRYSPGYCNWDVSEQQKLFRLFPKNCCGITLSDSSLMMPIKSISALLGIGTSVKYQDYTCEICSMKECAFRKTRNQ